MDLNSALDTGALIFHATLAALILWVTLCAVCVALLRGIDR